MIILKSYHLLSYHLSLLSRLFHIVNNTDVCYHRNTSVDHEVGEAGIYGKHF
jgi:hypothetical protein